MSYICNALHNHITDVVTNALHDKVKSNITNITSGNRKAVLLFNMHCIQYVIGCILGPDSTEDPLETKILQQNMFLRLNYTRETLVSLVVVGWEHVFRRLGLV